MAFDRFDLDRVLSAVSTAASAMRIEHKFVGGGVKPSFRRLPAIAAVLAVVLTALTISPAPPAQAQYTPAIRVQVLVDELNIPWDLTFTPDGTMLFTERGGRITARRPTGNIVPVSADMSDLYRERESGLMAILVDRNFNNNRRFYTCQVQENPREVQVIAWTISSDYSVATRVNDPLVGGIPAGEMGYHSGCRLRFGPGGYLWISTGDAEIGSVPQDLTSLGGKVLRVNSSTGAGVPGNPFYDDANENTKRVYTYGHRNVQGLALRPGTNQMWAVEHGPTGHDEINLLVKGGNYGWDPKSSDPTCSPGSTEFKCYEAGSPMTDTQKFPNAIRPKWTNGDPPPNLAPSGGIFLTGSQWGNWRGQFAVALLVGEGLFRFQFDSNGARRGEPSRVGQLERIRDTDGENRSFRLRTPMMGPDGALYVTTSNDGNNDKILRVTASRPPPPPPTRDPDPPRNNNGGGGGGGGGGGSRARSTPTPVPNNPPEFEEGAIVTVSVRENSPAGTAVGGPITATDPEGDDVRYELGGRDAELFDIDEDTGQITVAEGATLDYETDKLHHVTVTAEDIDGSGEQATIDVNINVTDDERLPGKADNYDANRDDALDVTEVLASINDYFDGDLTLEEVIAIINAYLDSGS